MPTRRRMRSTVISRCSAPSPETTSSRVASSVCDAEARDPPPSGLCSAVPTFSSAPLPSNFTPREKSAGGSSGAE